MSSIIEMSVESTVVVRTRASLHSLIPLVELVHANTEIPLSRGPNPLTGHPGSTSESVQRLPSDKLRRVKPGIEHIFCG